MYLEDIGAVGNPIKLFGKFMVDSSSAATSASPTCSSPTAPLRIFWRRKIPYSLYLRRSEHAASRWSCGLLMGMAMAKGKGGLAGCAGHGLRGHRARRAEPYLSLPAPDRHHGSFQDPHDVQRAQSRHLDPADDLALAFEHRLVCHLAAPVHGRRGKPRLCQVRPQQGHERLEADEVATCCATRSCLSRSISPCKCF